MVDILEKSQKYFVEEFLPGVPTLDGEFFHFRLEAALLWDQDIRDELSHRLPVVSLIPFKSGQGMKNFESGLIQITPNYEVPCSMKIAGTTASFSQVSEARFKEGKRNNMIKVFFKGFPFQAKKNDIKNAFDQFGSVEYVYFMCAPKRTKHPFRMGYVIFDCRESAENLLNHKEPYYYLSHLISVEEFRTNKKPAKVKTEVQSVKGSSKRMMTEYSQNELGIGVNNTPSFRTITSQLVDRKSKPDAPKSGFFKPSLETKGTFSKGKCQEWLNSSGQVTKNSYNCDNLRFNILPRPPVARRG